MKELLRIENEKIEYQECHASKLLRVVMHKNVLLQGVVKVDVDHAREFEEMDTLKILKLNSGQGNFACR